jgi:hypothetical protein
MHSERDALAIAIMYDLLLGRLALFADVSLATHIMGFYARPRTKLLIFQGGLKVSHHSVSIIASKTRQPLTSTLIVALVPLHDQALVLTGLNVVGVRC